jgi:hypothetical protein
LALPSDVRKILAAGIDDDVPHAHDGDGSSHRVTELLDFEAKADRCVLVVGLQQKADPGGEESPRAAAVRRVTYTSGAAPRCRLVIRPASALRTADTTADHRLNPERGSAVSASGHLGS